MSRNVVFIVIVFLAGLVSIVGGYIIFISGNSDSYNEVHKDRATAKTARHGKARLQVKSADEGKGLRKTGRQTSSIAEAVKRFEEQQNKGRKPESEQAARRKKMQSLVDTAAKDLAGNSNSDEFKTEIDKIKRGQKPDPEIFKEIIIRKEQDNKSIGSINALSRNSS